jgi:hypothetical protein
VNDQRPFCLPRECADVGPAWLGLLFEPFDHAGSLVSGACTALARHVASARLGGHRAPRLLTNWGRGQFEVLNCLRSMDYTSISVGTCSIKAIEKMEREAGPEPATSSLGN